MSTSIMVRYIGIADAINLSKFMENILINYVVNSYRHANPLQLKNKACLHASEIVLQGDF